MDDSFKKPGAIPFKWEIRPGVPKLRQSQEPLYEPHCGLLLHKVHNEPPSSGRTNSSPNTPCKLRPPPAGLNSPRSTETRASSFLGRSQRFLARPECVVPIGCFPSSPLVKRKNEKKNVRAYKVGHRPASELDYSSDIEIVSRWSVSSRKSISPFRDSPRSYSFSSYKSSPYIADSDWAGFGLF